MNKKYFKLLINSLENPVLRIETIGDGSRSSVYKRIVVDFSSITSVKNINYLFDKTSMHNSFMNKHRFVIQSFYFGYIGWDNDKRKKVNDRLDKAFKKYERWKNE